jgi:hypothetical protein
MACGGTRTAGFAFIFSKDKQQQINELLLSSYPLLIGSILNFVSSL